MGLKDEYIEQGQHVDNIISKIPDGNEKYVKSNVFRTCVDHIARGADPIVILDQVITQLDELQETFSNHIRTGK